MTLYSFEFKSTGVISGYSTGSHYQTDSNLLADLASQLGSVLILQTDGQY